MTRTNRRPAALIASLLLAISLATASAQVDARARALLEGLQPVTTEELRNVDQTVVTTTYVDGDEMETNSRIVIDFEGRRLVMLTEVMPGMSTSVVLKDGQVTMSMPGMPMTLPVPPETATELEKMFDQNEPILLKEGDVATYDGEVDYGGIVSGEQVTYTFHDESGEPTTIQYLFKDSKIIGIHMDMGSSGEMLVAYDTAVDTQALMGYDSTTYMLEGGAWNIVSRARVEAVAYNVVLDESLFE